MVADTRTAGDEAEGLQTRAEALAAAAAREPTFVDDLVQVVAVDAEYGGDPNGETFERLYERFSEYLGNWEVSQVLLGLVSTPDEDRQDLIEAVNGLPEGAAEPLWTAVRKLRALHGRYLELAARMWGENPDDWMSASADVDYSLGLEAWQLSMGLTKYSGEQVRLSGAPTSFLNLAGYVLSTLNQMPPDNTEFTPESMEAILLTMDDFRQLHGAVTAEPEHE